MSCYFLFDLDQTLLDFHASERKALEIVLTTHGLSFSQDIYLKFKSYNKSLWLEFEKENITRKELFVKRFNYLLDICEGESSSIDPLTVNDEFIYTMSCNGVLMDGALDFLKKLRRIEASKIYIITNGAVINAQGRIRSTGIDQLIDGIYISEDMGVSKPSEAYFDMCLKDIGAQKEDCIVIGDSLSSDMLGAKNTGIDSVWFMPTGNIDASILEYNIKYCANDYDELYDVLSNWSKYHI
ncbi:MAG: YjjG family noncanonical pyrimidine nucleotidase [Clostridiales bacterium]|nr:YjjG family noncanonical pyrimidine nucleotidase [Clostridiales bacterium]